MKKIFAVLAAMAFALVSCNPDIEPSGPSAGQDTTTTTPVVPPPSAKIVIGICHSGMTASGLSNFQKCIGDAGGTILLNGNYCYTKAEAEAYVAKIDALISPGSTSGDADGSDGKPKRSVSDNNLIQAALDAGKPILGICYGHQRLNVVLGGSTKAVSVLAPSSEVTHKLSQNGSNVGLNTQIHAITVDSTSILYTLLGETKVMVNSSHEFAVANVSSKVWVTARADDGIVEAIEGKDNKRIMGVQFHPEVLYGKMGLVPHLRIFDWFIAQAKEAKKERESSSSGGGE